MMQSCFSKTVRHVKGFSFFGLCSLGEFCTGLLRLHIMLQAVGLKMLKERQMAVYSY
jgi:hypothetical protein